MSLINEELRCRLPPLDSQEAEEEPLVYGRFYLPGTDRSWYAIEGQPDGEDFVVFCFVSGIDEFRTFRLSELECIRGPFDARVDCDRSFIPRRLTDVVPAPES